MAMSMLESAKNNPVTTVFGALFAIAKVVEIFYPETGESLSRALSAIEGVAVLGLASKAVDERRERPRNEKVILP